MVNKICKKNASPEILNCLKFCSLYACFLLSSSEAIEWLHKNLQKNPNFGRDVTKEQTILLLKKLFRAGIIENVREDSNDEEFKVDKKKTRQVKDVSYYRRTTRGVPAPLVEFLIIKF